MYAFRALLDKQPVTISAAVIAVLNVFVVAGVISLSGQTVAASNTALVLVLGLFIQSKTTNTAVLGELGDTTTAAAQEAARATVKALRPRPLRADGG